jgi:hypothetical protein
MLQFKFKRNIGFLISRTENYSNSFVVIAFLKHRKTHNTHSNNITRVRNQILLTKFKGNHTVKKIAYIKNNERKEVLLLIQKNCHKSSTSLKI